MKIEPSKIQPNYIPIGLQPIKEAEGFKIDAKPAPNTSPVGEPTNWDDIESVNKPEDNAMDLGNHEAGELQAARNYETIVDAAGTGDYTNIQAALDAGKTNIFVRAGTYTITSPIIVASSATSIIGESRITTTIIFSADVASDINMMELGDGTNLYKDISIKNISFDGNKTNQATANDGLTLKKVSKVFIENCRFSSFNNKGIDITDDYGNNITINKCYFQTNKYDIYGTNFFYSQIINNTFVGSGSVANSANIYLNQSYSIGIVNNIFNGGDYSIYCVGGNDRDLQYINISNNIIFGADLAAITFDYNSGSKEVKHNIISNNNIYSNPQHAIYINQGIRNIISNNAFTSNAYSAANTYSHIILDNASIYNNIQGNNIKATNSKYGIREENANCNYNLISNNIIQNATTGNISIQGVNTIKSNNIE